MIILLYPEKDYTSADIAIKVQALAAGQNKAKNIYVIPKHYGRNENEIQKKMDKAKEVLLLAYDKLKLDDGTTKELDYLLDRGVKVHAIVPSEAELPNTPLIERYNYAHKDRKAFTETINTMVGYLSKQAAEELRDSTHKKTTELMVVAMALVLSIVLLSSLGDGRK